MKKLSTLFLVLLVMVLPLLTWFPSYGKDAKKSEKTNQQVENVSSFEQAVQIIKKYEGLHAPKHWPLVGYGHLVKPGEKYSRSKALSEKEAEALLRKDLLKNCAVFREYGKDSLLLGVLAYNIGSGATLKSTVAKKLKSGNRDIKESYLSHCRYRGKALSGLKKRRIEEFEVLFVKDGEAVDMAMQADSAASKSSIARVDTPSHSNTDNNLFASVFSPVRLMLGALSNPFRLASSQIKGNMIIPSFNKSVSNSLCALSI